MIVAYIPVIIIGTVIVGWLIWMLFFKNKYMARYAAAAEESQKMFDANKDAILSGYLNDDEKFGMFSKALEGETILGIASYVEPKSIGKSMTEGLKTAITRVKKVNMDLFYIVITDKYFHLIESSGETIVDHTVLDPSEMKNVQVNKTTGYNLKNMATGASQEGDLNILKFSYKGENYSYNLYKMIYGYPCFTVGRDFQDNLERTFPGIKTNRRKVSDPETQMEMTVDNYFYDGFKKAMEDKFHVKVPA